VSKKRIAYRVLVGKPAGKRPLGKHWHRWEDNIKTDLIEIGRKGVNLIHLDQDRAR
jgi:hypothetical protein